MGVVERGALRGREQEWNISEAELEEMVEADVLSKQARTCGVTFSEEHRSIIAWDTSSRCAEKIPRMSLTAAAFAVSMAASGTCGGVGGPSS